MISIDQEEKINENKPNNSSESKTSENESLKLAILHQKLFVGLLK